MKSYTRETAGSLVLDARPIRRQRRRSPGAIAPKRKEKREAVPRDAKLPRVAYNGADLSPIGG